MKKMENSKYLSHKFSSIYTLFPATTKSET